LFFNKTKLQTMADERPLKAGGQCATP